MNGPNVELRQSMVVSSNQRPFSFDTTCVLVTLMVLFGLARTWYSADTSAAIDFYQFWVMGQAIGTPDVNNIYSQERREILGAQFLSRFEKSGESKGGLVAARHRKTLETYSTPFLYSAFRLFSTGAYDFDLTVFRLVSLSTLLLSTVVFCRVFGYSLPGTIAAAALFVGYSEPVGSELRVGNVNILLLGFVTFWLWVQCRSRSVAGGILAGAVLGFAAMFKPTVMPVAGLVFLSLLVDRDFGSLLLQAFGFGLGVVVAVSYTACVFGSVRCWIEWISAVMSMPEQVIPLRMGNLALGRAVSQWTGIGPIWLAAAALASAVCAVWAARNRLNKGGQTAREEGQQHQINQAGVIAAGSLIYLISGTLVWLHYFVLAIPAALLALRSFQTPPRADIPERFVRQVLATLAVFGVNFNPLWVIQGEAGVNFFAVLVCLSLVILFALALRDIWSPLEEGDRSMTF